MDIRPLQAALSRGGGPLPKVSPGDRFRRGFVVSLNPYQEPHGGGGAGGGAGDRCAATQPGHRATGTSESVVFPVILMYVAAGRGAGTGHAAAATDDRTTASVMYLPHSGFINISAGAAARTFRTGRGAPGRAAAGQGAAVLRMGGAAAVAGAAGLCRGGRRMPAAPRRRHGKFLLKTTQT